MESPSDRTHDLDDADHAIAASETHISILFFAPDRVYKLLKPLATGFLDHSTVERRLDAVTAECELNRRIAPDVYLGTSDLREHDEVVDRMLIMRRLPAERQLSKLIDEPDFDDHLRQIAHRVATFHAAASPVQELYTMTTASGLLSLWEASFDEIEPSVGPVIDAEEFDQVKMLARAYLDHSERLFDDRRRQGLMRDGHGDLTADDIFMIDDGPRILDCLAFADDYRISDVLADVAFLAMDLERLGGPEPARHFLTSYCEFVDENHPSSLADHYIAYRAHVRAKVALLRHRQGDDAAAEIAVRRHQQARDHLERARRRLVLVGGGPGSGKTTVARGLADRFSWSVIDSDTYRKDLRGIDYDDHHVERHPHLYDEQTTAATYTGLIERAGALLEAGESAIIDATWNDSDHRSLARDLAERRGAELVELECRVDREIARQAHLTAAPPCRRCLRRIARPRRRDGATPRRLEVSDRDRHGSPDRRGRRTGGRTGVEFLDVDHVTRQHFARGAHSAVQRLHPTRLRPTTFRRRGIGVATGMIILGIVLIVLGAVIDIPIVYSIGVILAIVGVVLWILGAAGRAVGGRSHWY